MEEDLLDPKFHAPRPAVFTEEAWCPEFLNPVNRVTKRTLPTHRPIGMARTGLHFLVVLDSGPLRYAGVGLAKELSGAMAKSTTAPVFHNHKADTSKSVKSPVLVLPTLVGNCCNHTAAHDKATSL